MHVVSSEQKLKEQSVTISKTKNGKIVGGNKIKPTVSLTMDHNKAKALKKHKAENGHDKKKDLRKNVKEEIKKSKRSGKHAVLPLRSESDYAPKGKNRKNQENGRDQKNKGKKQ